MPVYAKLIDGVPSGHHVNYDAAPATTTQNGKTISWLPVVYGARVTAGSFDPISEQVVASRTVVGDTVEYAEVVEELPLDSIRANKLRDLQEAYDAILEAGYTDPNTNRVLPMGNNNRNAYHGYFTQLDFNLRAGNITGTDPALISDIDDLPIEGLTVADVMGILTQYAVYYQTQWSRIAAANANLQAAADKASILAVTI